MKKNILSIMIIIIVIVCFVVPCFAGWLISHKPEYKGKIIDAETKEPIEGVVIVAMYTVHPIVSGPGGGSSRIIHIKETLTDEKGEFVIPPYTTLMSPNAFDLDPDFIIYKPGYASYPENMNKIYPFQYCGPAYLFKEEKVGKQEEMKNGSEVVTVIFGVAELLKLKIKNERSNAMPARPTDWENKVPNLNRLLKDEDKYLYGRGSSK
jgi:hypothetical protein